jgi:hypothetical protein
MGMKTSVGLLRRYDKEIAGVLGCYDRLVVTGTLTEIAYPELMDSYLYREGFRAFDIGQFADPLRQRIRDNVVRLAREAGVEIEYLSRSKGVRKEDLVAKVLARRGHHPGWFTSFPWWKPAPLSNRGTTRRAASRA